MVQEREGQDHPELPVLAVRVLGADADAGAARLAAAIWDAWSDGTKLDFRGRFYTHTLMTPFFNPGKNPYGPPKVFLAGVGDLMTEVAGEVCDGFLAHAFSTPRYMRERTMPALERGLAKSGRSRKDFEVTCPGFMVLGNSDDEIEKAAAGVRQQIAFYGSTP